MQFVLGMLILGFLGWISIIKLLEAKPSKSLLGELVFSTNMEGEKSPMTKSNKPMEVIIKDPDLDLSKIAFSENEEDKSLFRPREWNEYISQENVKGEMIDNVKGCLNLGEPYPHTILSGSAGHGKTALAELLAKEMEVPFVQCIGNDLTDRQIIVDKISQAQGGILFIDEIHTISNKIGNWLLPVIEDFKIQGQRIEKFTLIGATTEKGELIRRLKPFVDRFEQLELEHYKVQDIEKIVKQYHKIVYSEHHIDDEVISKISLNSRLTPRNALRLLRAYIRIGDIDKVLERKGIILDGYTVNDLKLLDYLSRNEKPVGLEGISLYLNTSKINYTYEIEGFLVQQGLVVRQPRGRVISERGKQILSKLRQGR